MTPENSGLEERRVRVLRSRSARQLARHPRSAGADVLLHSALVRVCPAEVQATVDQKMGEKFHLVTYPGRRPAGTFGREIEVLPSGVKATLVETFRGPAGSVIDRSPGRR